MLLIGSKAIKYWYPEFDREPKDTDYACSLTEMGRLKREPHTEYLLNPIIGGMTGVCPPATLLTLKASHLCWNINWDKHMFDVQFLLRHTSIVHDLFFEFYGFFNTVHAPNKRSRLNQSKEEFFDNAINYDSGQHDELHLRLNPVPVYTTILKDGAEVELDENKFRGLSHQDKVRLVQEEVMVMAFERFSHLPYRVAYSAMLKKFIRSHAPIWSLIWIIENYIQLHIAPYNYYGKINHDQVVQRSDERQR